MQRLPTVGRLLVSVALLIVVFAAVRYAVARYRRPGSATLLAAQAMDMNAMRAAPGLVPVAAEQTVLRRFAPAVTYTGSVVAWNDEDVYPRVTGTLVDLLVYPGGRVRAGQVIGHLDSAELDSRTREAQAAERAAQAEVPISEAERLQAEAQSRSALARVRSLENMLADVSAQAGQASSQKEQAGQELEAARSVVVDAEANVAAMEADAAYWDKEIAREERLYQARAVSGEEYQREAAQGKAAQAKVNQASAAVAEKRFLEAAARSKVAQAQAAIAGVAARLEQVKADLAGAREEAVASLAASDAAKRRIAQRHEMVGQAAAQVRTARIVRGYAALYARQDGVVTERLASPGTLVQPGMAILRIKNVSRVRLQANVAEADLAGIRVGNPVWVTTARDPASRLEARVTALFSAANPQSRTVIVEASVENPGRRFLPGQYVAMRIATDTPRRVLTVPQTAIRRDMDQRPFVWVASTKAGQPDQRVARRVSVTLGASDGQRVAVESGLRDGDVVIYQGHEYLKEGDGVFLTDWTEQGPNTLPPASGKMAPMPGMADMPGMEGTPGAGKAPAPPGNQGSHSMPGMNHPAPAGSMDDMPGMKGGN